MLVLSGILISKNILKPSKMYKKKSYKTITKHVRGSYEERLRKLHLPTLTFRRIRGDMIETYTIMHEIYDTDVTTFLKLRNQETERTSLRSHKYQLYIEPINKNIRKYNFSIRIINIWNNLPREVAEAPSVNTFKNRLDRYWRAGPAI